LTDHDGLNKTFHGSRIRKGTEKSISLSFDPNNLVCVSCATEHAIVKTKPVAVFFSDQNFVSLLEGAGQSCPTVVRMKDATLSDLYELSKELFGNVKFPEGSVFLYGSSFYLSRVGTGVYAGDWLSVISHEGGTWPGIRICPLIPLIISDVPGSLAPELSELAAWLEIVYDNQPARDAGTLASCRLCFGSSFRLGDETSKHGHVQDTSAPKSQCWRITEQHDILLSQFASGKPEGFT
jgi:hypothetical protein